MTATCRRGRRGIGGVGRCHAAASFRASKFLADTRFAHTANHDGFLSKVEGEPELLCLDDIRLQVNWLARARLYPRLWPQKMQQPRCSERLAVMVARVLLVSESLCVVVEVAEDGAVLPAAQRVE
eukprot:5838582-Pleurochrysis_carterae.AAC.1